MPIKEVLRLAFESLLVNKFRSSLTMLGLIIGVGAVVLLVSIGNGAKKFILGEFEGLGTNIIVVQPGKSDRKTPFGPPIGAAQHKMTIADVTALEKRAFNLEAVTGLILGSATVRYQENLANVNVFGANESFLGILNIKVGEGEWISREEDDWGRRVVVLGRNIAYNLFQDESPLGRQVRINQSEFRVIGVMERIGSKLGLSLDDFVFVPTHAALRLFNEDKLFGIRAKAWARSAIDDAVEELSYILRDRRQGEEDFTVVTQVAMMESMATILNMLTYVLGGIALISMLVGGIGIMNIMLVSVSERIPEIGLRRAVGARRRDILAQFLCEALVLAVSGGLVGLLLAVGAGYGVYLTYPRFDMRPPLWIIFPAFLSSVAVGLIFGVWPARKASRIEVLEALRYE